MIESHYSLNVSIGGHHYCRINLGTYEPEARDRARNIIRLLGKGYECDLTYVECVGHQVKI